MSTPLHIGESIQDALEGSRFQLVSSDGNEVSLASQKLVSDLQHQGLDVSANKPSGTSAAFNAQVADVMMPEQPALDAPSIQPALKNDDFGLGQ